MCVEWRDLRASLLLPGRLLRWLNCAGFWIDIGVSPVKPVHQTMLSSVASTWPTVGKYGRHPRRDARHVFSRHIAILPPVETRKATVDIPGNCDFFARFDVARGDEAEVVVGRAGDDDLELSIW